MDINIQVILGQPEGSSPKLWSPGLAFMIELCRQDQSGSWSSCGSSNAEALHNPVGQSPGDLRANSVRMSSSTSSFNKNAAQKSVQNRPLRDPPHFHNNRFGNSPTYACSSGSSRREETAHSSNSIPKTGAARLGMRRVEICRWHGHQPSVMVCLIGLRDMQHLVYIDIDGQSNLQRMMFLNSVQEMAASYGNSSTKQMALQSTLYEGKTRQFSDCLEFSCQDSQVYHPPIEPPRCNLKSFKLLILNQSTNWRILHQFEGQTYVRANKVNAQNEPTGHETQAAELQWDCVVQH